MKTADDAVTFVEIVKGSLAGLIANALGAMWLFWPAVSRAAVLGTNRKQVGAILIGIVLGALPTFWGASRLAVRHWGLFRRILPMLQAVLLTAFGVCLPGLLGYLLI